VINPYPFSPLNHFTVPFILFVPPTFYYLNSL
jgi:hypothetical protein